MKEAIELLKIYVGVAFFLIGAIAMKARVFGSPLSERELVWRGLAVMLIGAVLLI